MSIKKLKEVISNLNCGKNWNIQVFKINVSKNSSNSSIKYCCRKIELMPPEELMSHFYDIKSKYLDGGENYIDSYQDLREYDGSADVHTIYKLSKDNELISMAYCDFMTAIANASSESSPLDFNTAFLIKGYLTLNGSNVDVKIVSMMRPVTRLNKKYIWSNDKFEKCESIILNFRPKIDVLIVDSVVYFFNLSGEKLFNMERSYKNICSKKVAEIEQADIVSDMESFYSVATKGHNPRRFVSFDESKLKALHNPQIIRSISEQLEIPLDKSGIKFDTSCKESSEKLVKFLCNKAVADIISKKPFEADGLRTWR